MFMCVTFPVSLGYFLWPRRALILILPNSLTVCCLTFGGSCRFVYHLSYIIVIVVTL
jgi:hypothetical protein